MQYMDMADRSTNAKSFGIMRWFSAEWTPIVRLMIVAFGIYCVSSLVILPVMPRAAAQTQSTTSSSTTAVTLRAQIPASQTDAQQAKRMSLSWKFGLGAESFANEKEQVQSTGFGVQGDLRYRLLRSLDLSANARALLQSGYAQSRFGDNAPSSGVALGEAVLRFRPVSFFSFHAGAIDQGHLEAPLLVSSRPFPGVLQKLMFGDRDFSVVLRTQQTVPTSTTLSTRAVEAEVTPYFLSETLAMKARAADWLTLKTYGSHFMFRSLPSTVAFESEPYGNTVEDLGPNSSRFKFGFEGWVAGGGGKIQFSPAIAWNLDGQVIQNTQAPETYRNAQMASSGFEIALPSEIDLLPKAEVFFAESDVAPAFYNSSEYGHNNRTGWAAELGVKFRQAGFKLGGRYVDAEVINPSHDLNQSRQQYMMLRFETTYEVL